MGRPGITDERRHHRRLMIELPVRIGGSDRQGREFEEETCTINVSTGGAYLNTTQDLQPSTAIDVIIHLPREFPQSLTPLSVRAKATIIRIDDRSREPANSVSGRRVALRFSQEPKVDVGDVSGLWPELP